MLGCDPSHRQSRRTLGQEDRLRLDITSSDFPNYDRNHNTAADQNADAVLDVARQTIYHGAEHATRIVLPWIPNKGDR